MHGVHGKPALFLVVAALKTETEQLVKRPYLVEMSVLEITQKHNPAIVMAAQVCVYS